MELKDHCQQYVDNYSAEVATLKRKNSGFVAGELLLFGGMLVCIVCHFALDGDTGRWLWGAVVALLAYFNVRHLDDKNKERIEHLSSLLKVCEDEIKALEGDFSPFEQGVQYQDPKHPYAFDLDVFGRDSLFHRICRTITTGGSDALAAHLSHVSPLTKKEIERRRDLQRELAAASFEWRMEFLALGVKNKKKINSSAVADAVRRVATLQVPAWFGSSLSLALGVLLIIGVCASVLLAIFDVVSANVPLSWVMVQFIVVFYICKATLDKIDSRGGKLRSQLMAYSQILQLIAHRNFQSEMGREMQAQLAGALPSFAQLEKILKGYDRRGNFLGLFFTDSFMLSDFFLIRQFLTWKENYMVKMEEWMDIVSEMDAMVSMADFRYNHPEATDAEILNDTMTLDTHDTQNAHTSHETLTNAVPVVFESKNLYHPFLGVRAVKNDFSIKDGNYYIITGANMAGKSTFLRSLGVNYILAMAGMPVFADSLKVSRFRLFSSMRTSDDLTHGISYFNAELLRLEQLLQFCQDKSCRTLIILDEILKGTNSVDKLNGSRLFLESIAQLPVSGIIATHDLELSKMSEQKSCFHNYCFEIELGTDVTYTYKIQPGVAKNQNATFLLKHLIGKFLP